MNYTSCGNVAYYERAINSPLSVAFFDKLSNAFPEDRLLPFMVKEVMPIEMEHKEHLDYRNEHRSYGNGIRIRLKKLRQSKKLTQVNFAKMLGYSRSTIAQIETNRLLVSENLYYDLMKHFDKEFVDSFIIGGDLSREVISQRNITDSFEKKYTYEEILTIVKYAHSYGVYAGNVINVKNLKDLVDNANKLTFGIVDKNFI